MTLVLPVLKMTHFITEAKICQKPRDIGIKTYVASANILSYVCHGLLPYANKLEVITLTITF